MIKLILINNVLLILLIQVILINIIKIVKMGLLSLMEIKLIVLDWWNGKFGGSSMKSSDGKDINVIILNLFVFI